MYFMYLEQSLDFCFSIISRLQQNQAQQTAQFFSPAAQSKNRNHINSREGKSKK